MVGLTALSVGEASRACAARAARKQERIGGIGGVDGHFARRLTRTRGDAQSGRHPPILEPGPFQSRLMRATLERVGDAITEMVLLGRIGSPEDMAGIAIFLA